MAPIRQEQVEQGAMNAANYMEPRVDALSNAEVLEAILKYNPGLTREEVLELAAEMGFDLTGAPPSVSVPDAGR